MNTYFKIKIIINNNNNNVLDEFIRIKQIKL
jgi:hypothetical protein